MGDCLPLHGHASMVAKGGNVQQTIVKKYKGEKRFRKDAEKLAKAGYRVVSVNDQGKPFLQWGPLVPRRYLVTYVKDA